MRATVGLRSASRARSRLLEFASALVRLSLEVLHTRSTHRRRLRSNALSGCSCGTDCATTIFARCANITVQSFRVVIGRGHEGIPLLIEEPVPHRSLESVPKTA
jgi:hypothetical protein